MKMLPKIFIWVRARFSNVWVDKYPKWWHIIDIVIGLVIALAFTLTFDGSTGVKVGLFFALVPLGYLFALAFTYGIVRSRNGWTKKRK